MKLLEWGDRAITRRLLALLSAMDVAQLKNTSKRSRAAIMRELRGYKRGSARVGLALWCIDHLELEFQSYYHDLETHNIPRSRVNDPRVPPRVVSVWSERGKVPNGVVRLRPARLPKRTEQGFALRFVATIEQRPMLTSVVQQQRRIYTVVSLQIANRRGAQETNEPTVLRRIWYVKEYGEWRTMMTSAKKQFFDTCGALCRYDLVSHDGSIALELDVPAGVDSMTDYYLVKKAAVFLSFNELWHSIVKGVRPVHQLPTPSSPPIECTVVLSFTSLGGDLVKAFRVPSSLTVSPQEPTQASATDDSRAADESAATNRPRTGMEHLDIITIMPEYVDTWTVSLPANPGYVWVSVTSSQETTVNERTRVSRLFAMAMLHGGAKRSRGFQQVDAQWVPGILESFPTLQSRNRRVLKGFLHVATDDETHKLSEMKIVAQHLSQERLRPYAATIESYSRLQT